MNYAALILLLAAQAVQAVQAATDSTNYPEVRVDREFKGTLVYPMPRAELESLREKGLLSNCPHGHTNLVDVPVRGGFAITDAQIDQVNLYHWWPGGCTRGRPDEINIRCTACDYMYEQAGSKWTRAPRLPRRNARDSRGEDQKK